MRFRVAWLAMLVSGCVPTAVTPDAGEPDAGEPDAGYLRDAVRVEATFFESRGVGVFPCSDGDGGTFEPSTWRLDLATRALSWRLCDAQPGGPLPPPGREGSRTLDASELEAFRSATSALVPAAQLRCVNDGDTQFLDVVTSTGSSRYWGNGVLQIPCSPNPARPTLDNMPPVFDVLTGFVR